MTAACGPGMAHMQQACAPGGREEGHPVSWVQKVPAANLLPVPEGPFVKITETWVDLKLSPRSQH